ncbi:MAG: polymerase sigma-B factor, partial [Actinomycetota bacterium]|nr:polymerase sigma-B factor [Actinomycetota bacterium]
VKDRYLAVGTATSALSQHLGRAPTIAEIATHLTLTREEVAEAVAAHGSYHPASLDETLGEGDDSSLANILGSVDPEFDRVEVRELVRSLVASLPPRERTMLALRFVHEQTQAEIASVLCISQMHVSRLLTRTLAQLRSQVEAQIRAEEGDGPPVAV